MQTPHDWLNTQADYLYRFALARLRDPHLAEDAVQETFLAAIKSQNFAGESSVRTWLTGILKHKIIDSLRKSVREVSASSLVEDDENLDDFFDAKGHWSDLPQSWGVPDDALAQQQLLAILQRCIDRLSVKQRSIFMLRDVEEMSNEEICNEMNISATNAWVMLHRARLEMRKCMEINWLGKS